MRARMKVLLAGPLLVLPLLAVGSRGNASPMSIPAVQRTANLAQVETLAIANGEPDATSYLIDRTNGLRAAEDNPVVDSGPTKPVVVTVASGDFVGHTARIPSRQALPTGTVLLVVTDATTNVVTDWGMLKTMPDLSSLGTAFTLDADR